MNGKTDVKKLEIFPGSKAEYEEFKGYKVEIMEITPNPDITNMMGIRDTTIANYNRGEPLAKTIERGLWLESDKHGNIVCEFHGLYDFNALDTLIKDGMEALINAQRHMGAEEAEETTIYGLPVRKRKNKGKYA